MRKQRTVELSHSVSSYWTSTETWLWLPPYPCWKSSMVAYTCNPSDDEADWRIPGTQWIDPNWLGMLQAQRETLSQMLRWRVTEEDFWYQPLASTCTCAHMCTHSLAHTHTWNTHTYSHTHKENVLYINIRSKFWINILHKRGNIYLNKK